MSTVDGAVHSLNALSGDVLWSYQTEAIMPNEQLSFMAQGQNVTFYPDRRKGDIYTSLDGKSFVPFPTAKKLVEMSPFQWPEGRAIFLAKKTHKRYFVDPESGDDIALLQCDLDSPSTPLGLRDRWLEIIRTDYDIVAEQLLDAENPFPVATSFSQAPKELEVLKFSVSDFKLFLRTVQSVPEDEVSAAPVPRLIDEGGVVAAHHPTSNQLLWQRKFKFPITHAAFVLTQTSDYEFLSSVKVEDAALEYLAIAEGEDTGLIPLFPLSPTADDIGSEEVKLLPAPPPHFTEIQLAVIIGAVVGGIFVLMLILVYVKCIRVRLPPPPPPSPAASPAATPAAPSPALPAAILPPCSPVASAVLQSPPAPAMPTPLTPNLTSLVRYRREFVELGGLEGEEGKNLGKGGFGTVVRVRNITDENFYAMKKVRKFGELSTVEIDQILREVKVLAKLDHPHIVRYFGSWTEEEEISLEQREELAEQSSTRTLSLAPSRAKRKPSTILEAAASPVEPADIDDLLGFEFQADSNMNGLQHGSSDSLSSLPSLPSELSDLSHPTSSPSATHNSQLSQSSQASSGLSPLCLDPSKEAGHQKQWTLFIQMQLCSSTLEHWMAKRSQVDPEENLVIFEQIASALRYVHNPPHGLIHRDLKPANIFMMEDRSVRVGDFGLSKRTHRMEAGCGSQEESLSHTAGVGSPLYCSPEQLAGREYTNKTDIFSLGVIFVEMHHIFSTKMERNICLQDYRHSRFPESPNHVFGPGTLLGQFVRQLLHPDPSQRPTAQQVLEHDVFKRRPPSSNP